MKTNLKLTLSKAWRRCLAIGLIGLAAQPVVAAHQEVWRTVLDYDAGETDVTRFIGEMSNGDFILAGRTSSGATGDILLYRMRADGSLAWTKTLNNDRSDDAVDLVTDPSTGDTYICGSTSVLTPLTPSPQYRTNWYVMKISGADGAAMWGTPYTYDGGFTENESATCIALAMEGGVPKVIVGGSRHATPSVGGRLVKLNGTTGALEQQYDGPVSYFGVATDASGNVFACGRTNHATLNEARVQKFNSALSLQWDKTNGGSGTTNSWTYIDVDPVSGDAIVSGLIINASGNNDIGVARFGTATGTQAWLNLYNGDLTTGNNDSGTGVRVSGDSAYVSGTMRQTGTGADWFLARVVLNGGATSWQKTFSGGTANSGEQVGNFRVKGTKLYVAGHMTPVANRIPVLLELNIADGSTADRTDVTGRPDFLSVPGNKSIIVTSNNDIIFAGDSGNPTGAGVVTRYGPTSPAATAIVSSLNIAGTSPTNQTTVNWTLTFDIAVTGVTASHFTLGGTSTGAAVGTPSTGNGGLTWTVPVTTGTDGTLLLRLDNDTGLSSDVSTTLPFVGETYTVDKTPPDTTISAFPSNPSPFPTASFSFTGSDSGSGLASFQVQLDGAGFASSSSPANYTALANGSHTFQVRAVDAAGNMDPTPASYAWIVDTTPPQILSINRQNPSGQGISATSVTFRVTYSKPVTLNAPATARFAVVPVGGSSITGTVTGVSGSGVTRDVTVSITGGTGEFRLRAVD